MPKLRTVQSRMWHLLCVSTVMPPPGPSSTVQFFKTVRQLPLSTRHGERFAGLSTGCVLRRIVSSWMNSPWAQMHAVSE